MRLCKIFHCTRFPSTRIIDTYKYCPISVENIAYSHTSSIRIHTVRFQWKILACSHTSSIRINTVRFQWKILACSHTSSIRLNTVRFQWKILGWSLSEFGEKTKTAGLAKEKNDKLLENVRHFQSLQFLQFWGYYFLFSSILTAHMGEVKTVT